jgi:hypothetical protein
MTHDTKAVMEIKLRYIGRPREMWHYLVKGHRDRQRGIRDKI